MLIPVDRGILQSVFVEFFDGPRDGWTFDVNEKTELWAFPMTCDVYVSHMNGDAHRDKRRYIYRRMGLKFIYAGIL
jgi:hypothetical protein